MPATHEALSAESTLTDRYQTTIPEPVRRALGLSRRDRIRYEISQGGQVVLTRADEDDPALGAFLDFLAADIGNRPAALKSVDPVLARRLRSLVRTVDVDLDAPLPPEPE